MIVLTDRSVDKETVELHLLSAILLSLSDDYQVEHRQGPHQTLKKSDGRPKHLKRAFITLTAIIFSAKNGPKLKNLTFLESAVREFSENGLGIKKN